MLARRLRSPGVGPWEYVAQRDINYIRKAGGQPVAFLAHPHAYSRLTSAGVFHVARLPVVECPALNVDAVCVVTEEDYFHITGAHWRGGGE